MQILFREWQVLSQINLVEGEVQLQAKEKLPDRETKQTSTRTENIKHKSRG
jgi:hypothetical protein